MTHDQPAEDSAAVRGPEESKAPLPLWQESVILLVIALFLAVAIKFFFIQAFYIPSPSMEPQFIKNDRIIVEKWSYWGSKSPERGDIVVFEDPGGWLNADESNAPGNVLTKALSAIGLYPTGGHLVKRVIGTGGDHVICCDPKGRITVNGTALNEKAYLPKGTAPSTDKFNITVPEHKLWVMGDNRGNSYDSRGHISSPGGGYVDTDLVVGKVWTLIWPLNRAEIIHRPATFKHIPAPR